MIGKISTKTISVTTHTAELNAKEIRKVFGLPNDAVVEFFVPGGGDWSNTSISISEENPIHVTWKVSSEATA